MTLLELCFGLAVVAILTSLAVPGLHSAARGAAMRSATFELAAAMQQTRVSSIFEARPGVLCLSDAAGNCLPGADASTAWTAYLEVGGHRESIAGSLLPAGVVLRATRPKLNFWPDARAASTSTLTLCDTQGLARPRALVLSQTGRVRQAAADERDCRA